jgi:hypothetical protein
MQRFLSPAPLSLSFALAFAALGSTSDAAPLDTNHVPAKAVWLMHLDGDAVRKSTVIEQMHARVMKKHPQLEGLMAMGAAATGMDVRKDLHGVTVYGLDTEKQNAVMIVHAKADRKKLEAMVEKAPGHQSMEYRGFTLHAWTHKGWRQSEGKPVVGTFYDDSTMIFARTKQQVEMALDVLEGKRDSMDEKSPLAGRVLPGSILVGRASAVNPETKCPVLKEAKGFRVAMGENDGKSFYRAKLEMKSAEAATQAKAVTEGLAALASLSFGQEADVMKLVTGLETVTRGGTCLISWDADADVVWKVTEKVADKFEAKMAQRKQSWGQKDSGKKDAATKKQEKKPSSNDDRRPFRDDEF